MTILRDVIVVILIILLCLLLWIFVVARIIRKIHKFPIPAFFTRLIDNAWRRKYIQKPEIIADRMNLKPGMIVVEIGPGKGNYTKAVAERLLPGGKVYAIDIQESVIISLKIKVENENIPNIVPMIDDVYDLSFDNESVDRIFAIACLPEIPEPVRALKEFKRILKPGGIVSLCELFIDPDYPLRKTEIKWAETTGFKLADRFGNWFVYQLNFIKNKPSY